MFKTLQNHSYYQHVSSCLRTQQPLINCKWCHINLASFTKSYYSQIYQYWIYQYYYNIPTSPFKKKQTHKSTSTITKNHHHFATLFRANLNHDILQLRQLPDGTHRAAAGRNRWVQCRRPGDRRRLRDVVIRHGRVATEGGRLRLDAWRMTLIFVREIRK